MVSKILDTTDDRLRKKSAEVKKIDKKIKGLIQDLKDTLSDQKDPEGVGLAAPQIGKNVRIFLINYENEIRVVINPKVLNISKDKKTKRKGKKKEILEGCLSLPHYYGSLERAQSIEISYLNEEEKIVKKKFTGFMAQIIQHEIDHLNGILFIDHILEQKSPLYKVVGDEWEEVELH